MWFTSPRKSCVVLVDLGWEAVVNPDPSSELSHAAFRTLTELEPPREAALLRWKGHWARVAWIILTSLEAEDGAVSGQLGGSVEKRVSNLICLPSTDKIFSNPSHRDDSIDQSRLFLHAVEALVG